MTRSAACPGGRDIPVRFHFRDIFLLANPNSPVPNKNSIVRITEFVPISEVVHFYGRIRTICTIQGSIS